MCRSKTGQATKKTCTLLSQGAGLPATLNLHQLQARDFIESRLARKTKGHLLLIGMGGVMNPIDVQTKFEAGATLVQVYTGLVYAGPSLVKQINRALLEPAPSV